MSERSLAREAALRALFQVDAGYNSPDEALAYNLEGLAVPPSAADYARRVVEGTLQHLPQIDEMIGTYTVGWTVERLPRTDRMILRLAIYELDHLRAEVPVAVVINEAVELAKTYSDETSGRYVNGILSSVVSALGLQPQKS